MTAKIKTDLPPLQIETTTYDPGPDEYGHKPGGYILLDLTEDTATLVAVGYLAESLPSFFGEDTRWRQPFKVPAHRIKGRGRNTFWNFSYPWDAATIARLELYFGPAAVEAELERINGLGDTEEERTAAWRKEFEALCKAGLLAHVCSAANFPD